MVRVKDLSKAVIVPLFKGKGSRQDCNNYRGISLLSVVGKLYAKVLINRVVKEMEEKIWDAQVVRRGMRSKVMSIRPLHPELEKKSWEFKEDPQKLNDAIHHIKDWLTTQPHLNANTSDQWLASYIRGCRYDLDTVKTKLDLLYTCRVTAPEFFQLHHRSEKFKEIFRRGFYLPLPILEEPAAPRVCLIRPGLIDLSQENVLEALSVVQTIEKVMILDDDNSMIVGNINVIDYKESDLFKMVLLTITDIMRKAVICQELATPFLTINNVNINLSPPFDLFVGLINSLSNEEHKPRLFVHHGDSEGMYQQKLVPKEVMPAEYGGTGGTLEEIMNYWIVKLEQYDEWLEDDEQYGTDESKRPGQPKTSIDMFGGEQSLASISDAFKNIFTTE